jgi:hypothetical protein
VRVTAALRGGRDSHALAGELFHSGSLLGVLDGEAHDVPVGVQIKGDVLVEFARFDGRAGLAGYASRRYHGNECIPALMARSGQASAARNVVTGRHLTPLSTTSRVLSLTT